MDANAQSGRGIKHQWRLREALAAAFLFVLSAEFVWYQNTHVSVLWDLGYLLDTSWRIALGQMPYRDFPLAHAPLTFLIQAVLMSLYGRYFGVLTAYVMVASGLGSMLVWRILRRLFAGQRHGWWTALLLSIPLIALGIYAVYPDPIYDCDCALSMLIALALLMRIEDARGWFQPLCAGAAAVVPVFFKQNMGLPFLGSVAAVLMILYALESWHKRTSLTDPFSSRFALALAGIVLTGSVALLLLTVTVGINNYLHWTVQFAAQRRMPGLASMLGIYAQPSFVWAVPVMGIGLILCFTKWVHDWWGRALAFALVATPFLVTCVKLFLQDDADDRADSLLALWPLMLVFALLLAMVNLRRGITLRNLLPFVLLAAIHGTLMSQQLWGSTYALWPFLFLLIGWMLATLPMPARTIALPLSIVCCTTFGICGALYAISHERLSYIDLSTQSWEYSRTQALYGMGTFGPYTHNLDELVAFSEREIPWNDPLLLLPGEDPFYYATGRTPQFPVTLFDPATDPYNARQLMEEVHRKHVRWVIVKRALQIRENPMPDRDETMRRITQDFELYSRLAGYDIYRAH